MRVSTWRVRSWWQATLTLNTTAPNWTTLTVGHLLVSASGTHHFTLTADRGGFYMASLTLTPVNRSVAWFGTDPLASFSDGYTLADRAEVGLTNANIQHWSS